jgi:type I restriction enzyme S subunit
MKAWPKVRLGEVLRPVARAERVDASKEYRLLGIRLEGQGPFLRETLMGTQSSATKLFRVATDDFIYSRLFACRGAFGVISKELNGCYVSGEFPAFIPVPGKIDVEYLKYWFRLPSVIATVDADCSGSTPLTRNRFKENFFLALEIPLPPLAEQRRVVARIEELAAQIHEARTLRRQAAEEAEALGQAGGNSSFIDAKNRFGSKRLEELTTRISKGESPEWQGFAYQETGPYFIRSQNVLWGSLDPRNAVHIPEAFHAKLSRSQLRKDDVLINLVGASIGPIFLVHFLLSPIAQEAIHGGKVETARPNISLGDVRDLDIPTPPLPEQRRIVAELDALHAEVDGLKRLQVETAAELDALLPAILDRAFKGEL